jgi:hypothetical protein
MRLQTGARRQPLRTQSVTYVSGIIPNPCLRYGSARALRRRRSTSSTPATSVKCRRPSTAFGSGNSGMPAKPMARASVCATVRSCASCCPWPENTGASSRPGHHRGGLRLQREDRQQCAGMAQAVGFPDLETAPEEGADAARSDGQADIKRLQDGVVGPRLDRRRGVCSRVQS